jgi:hypothetical protein
VNTVSSRSRRAVVGIVVGLFGVFVGAVWIAGLYRSAIGADSPGQAVERFLLAVERADAVGIAQVLLPDESRLLAADGQRVVRQLGGFRSRPGSVGAKPVDFSNMLRWKVDSSSPRFAGVSAEQATVKLLVPDYPSDNPNVDRVTQNLNESRGGRWVRHFLSATGTETDHSLVLGAVRVNGRWYVSLASTSAHAWNRLAVRKQKAQGSRQPTRTNSSTVEEMDLTADSPEEAVQRWLDALVDLDYKTLRALSNPVETDAFPVEALQAVWGTRIEKLRRQFELSVAESTGESFVRSNRFGSHTVVPLTIRDAKFALTEPGAEPFVSQYHEGCLVVLSGGKATKHCGRQIPLFGEQFSIPVTKATIDRFVGRLDALAEARKALPGMVAVQHNGTWFVSPTQSLLLNLGEAMSNAKRADIAALLNDIENAISSEG